MSSTTKSQSTRPTPWTAVTSIFTPPSFCGGFVDKESWFSSASELSLGSCFPGNPSTTRSLSSWYYSPAICPSGYTPGCTATGLLELLPGETGIFCCPSSFKCAENVMYGCISGRTTALSMHIQWQESDLSNFETPPLTNGLPTRERHGGWDPAAALTDVYTFPPECASITSTWMPFTETACQELDGDYYSPGICPEGWTAAFTRPVLGSRGPPEEPDETAMMCCPSGMDTIPGEGCGVRYCASATFTTNSRGTTMLDLIMARDPIQIRWASSDLSLLETHPLTPGMIPTERLLHPKYPANYSGILPPLESEYKKAIGVAFIPLVLALLAAFVLLWWRRKKRQYVGVPTTQGGMPVQMHFKPKILSWPPLLVLIGVALTAIILLEISCHQLPRSDGPIHVPSIQLTKVYVRDITIEQRQIGDVSSIIGKMDCGVSGNYTMSPILTQNHGTQISTERPIGTYETVCELSSTSVLLPTCTQPPTAPNPDEWLSDPFGQGDGTSTTGTFPGQHFVAAMLAPLLAVLFAIPWKILHLHSASLESFRKLSGPKGTTVMKAMIRDYGGPGAVFALVPFITACLVYTSAILAPLSTESWTIELLGSCAADENKNCVPEMQAVPQVVRTMEALLAVIVLLAIALIAALRKWSTGVLADPRSIVGIASLSQSPELRRVFGSLLVAAGTSLSAQELKRQVGGLQVYLGVSQNTSGGMDYGITLLNPPQTLPFNGYHGKRNQRKSGLSDPLLKATLLLATFAVLLAAIMSIVLYYRLTGGSSGFERFMSGQGFGPRFLFSIFGVLINFGWVTVFSSVTRLTPYYALSIGQRHLAKTTILLPYATDPYTHLPRSILTGHIIPALVSFVTILSDFLPLLFANVPFHRTRTLTEHLVSCWMTVAILALMIVILVILAVVLIAARPRCTALLGVLTESPVVGTLLVLGRSDYFVGCFGGLAGLGTKERDIAVRGMELRYFLADVGDGVNDDGVAIHVQR